MRLSYVNIIFVHAGMSELADEADSKSVDGNIVWVQVPLPAYKRGCEKRIVPKKERPRVYNELKVFLSVIINLQ